MSSVMTEVHHHHIVRHNDSTAAHPWENMSDAKSHHSEEEENEQQFGPAYRSSTPSSASSSSTSHDKPDGTTTSAANTSSATLNRPPSYAKANISDSHAPSRPVYSSSSAPPSTTLSSSSSSSVAAVAMQDGPASPRLPTQTQGSPMNTTPTSASPAILRRNSSSGSPRRIAVQSLQHIQDIAGNDPAQFMSPPLSDQDSDVTLAPQYMISDMPVGDIIEMVAGLLTKITTTNDKHYEHLHRSIPTPDSAGHMSTQTSSVLAFHGKNVPSITILSYLSRIQRYCPATYEVFLSLLVYFDRMTERVNAGQMQSLRQANQESLDRHRRTSRSIAQPSPEHERTAVVPTPPSSNPLSPHLQRQRQPTSSLSLDQQAPPSPPLSDSDPSNLSHFFVVDSFNIHRLVIAGVTCAAKFFSDVFFTNSRYAKVGGLPLIELNHLELQFLLLNDFRLAIPVEELDQYATMLVAFYAREVAAQRQTEGMMEGVEPMSLVSR